MSNLELRKKRFEETVWYDKIIEERDFRDYSEFVVERADDVCVFRVYDSGEVTEK